MFKCSSLLLNTLQDSSLKRGPYGPVPTLQLRGVTRLSCAAAVMSTQIQLAWVMCRRGLDTFKRVFDVNVFGAFAAMQAFFPLVKVRHARPSILGFELVL